MTVALTITAVASAGTPAWPDTCTVRTMPGATGVDVRVSRSRTGSSSSTPELGMVNPVTSSSTRTPGWEAR
ncbi:hypothetical protein [Cellulomonas sp. Leaf334]|uniref:hypothetical protein n=1 Tax=Cellulomonas sp. Leaf334 TaxID=1736339 RepID=UPI0012E31F4F|nr:hypothetical protein [Cellulomonas sp. Leaf334]